MASIRKAKKLGTYVPIKKTKQYKDLLKSTRELVSQANRRLKGLKNAGLEGTWASKRLINRIDSESLKAFTKSGKIKLRNNLTQGQLMTINKATKKFLNSKTSKASGIEKAKKATLKTLKETLSVDKIKDDRDIEFLYDMLEEDSVEHMLKRGIKASELWALVDEAIEYNFTEKKFVNELLSLADFSNDLDAREYAKRIYDKYVL